jgi:hypothetical protein
MELRALMDRLPAAVGLGKFEFDILKKLAALLGVSERAAA